MIILVTADGFNRKTKTAYQFQGCFWHGCRKCHPENKEKGKKTEEINEKLTENGINLVEKPFSAYYAVLFFRTISYDGFLWHELVEIDAHAKAG